jgi:hypothetical protein
MLSQSKHGGQGLCARHFDKLSVTGPLFIINVYIRVLCESP